MTTRRSTRSSSRSSPRGDTRPRPSRPAPPPPSGTFGAPAGTCAPAGAGSGAEQEGGVGSKHPRRVFEAKPFVESPRPFVGSVDAENDVLPALLVQDRGDCAHQRLRNASAPRVRAGVEAEDVAEVLARGVGVNRADDAVALLGNERYVLRDQRRFEG